MPPTPPPPTPAIGRLIRALILTLAIGGLALAVYEAVRGRGPSSFIVADQAEAIRMLEAGNRHLETGDLHAAGEQFAAAIRFLKARREQPRAEGLGESDWETYQRHLASLEADAWGLRAQACWQDIRARHREALEKREREPGDRFRIPDADLAPLRSMIRAGLAVDAGHVELLHLQGKVSWAEGRAMPAIQSFRRALERAESRPELHNDLGVAYLHPSLQRSEDAAAWRSKAMASFEKAWLLSKEKGAPLPDALFNLGQCHFNLALSDQPLAPAERAVHRSKSRQFLESYLEQLPDTPDHRLGRARARETLRAIQPDRP